ncbi:phage tail protein [Pseudomonas reactans]|uniref:phage tail protein n=1 Tax=Pseudomonas reactans TaxID=117680 RepID=UPI0015A0E5A6|nr:phage tail protein [Pseudomonas reactans]NWF13665.1 phage tail protein [Pseudomonas reactans]
MIDQNSQFFAILTNVGAAKQANADALGIAWKITQMGVGDANNADPLPSAAQTALINEWRRAPLNQLKVDPNNAAIIIAEQVIPSYVGGHWIREIGLYDADGDLVAVANCAPSFKPLLNQGSGRTQVVRMNLQVSNASSVELKIDPSVVLATRAYVDLKVLEELNKQDFKHSVLVATTGPIVLSGLQTIDGVAVPAGKRVLVKDQAASKDNGPYVAAAGAWARTDDADVSVEMTPGLFVHVEQGTANSDSVWQLTTDAPIVLGTTPLTFEVVVGRTGVTAGTYRSVTVDKNGRVMGGTNPTTVAGYGITDAVTKSVIVSVAASKALAVNELGVVLIDATAASVTVTLPAADASLGVRDVIVRRTDNGGNRLVIQAAGTDKVKFHTHLRAEGYPFFVLMGAGDYWHLRSDGAGNWLPIARFDGTPLGRPVLETTTAFSPGGWAGHNGFLYNRAEWPWAWDHAQASGMLTTEALRAGKEGMWTSGDGATTFRSPEARGEFTRVLDESRGVDAARVAGSWQDGTWLRTVAQEWSGSDVGSGTYIIGNAHAQADGRISTAGVGGTVPIGATPPAGAGVYSAATTDNCMLGTVEVNTQALNNWIRFRSRNIAYPGRIKLI